MKKLILLCALCALSVQTPAAENAAPAPAPAASQPNPQPQQINAEAIAFRAQVIAAMDAHAVTQSQLVRAAQAIEQLQKQLAAANAKIAELEKAKQQKKETAKPAQ